MCKNGKTNFAIMILEHKKVSTLYIIKRFLRYTSSTINFYFNATLTLFNMGQLF